MLVFSEVSRIALIILINMASVAVFYWLVNTAHRVYRQQRQQHRFTAYFSTFMTYCVSAIGVLTLGLFSVSVTGGLFVPFGTLGVDPQGEIYQQGLYYEDGGAVIIMREPTTIVCYYNVERYNPVLTAGVCKLHYLVIDESLLHMLHKEFPDIVETRQVSQYFREKLRGYVSEAKTIAEVEGNIRDMCTRLRRCGIQSDVELTINFPDHHYEYQRHLDHTPLPL